MAALLIATLAVAQGLGNDACAQAGRVMVLPVEGAIGPATAEFVRRNLAKAADDKARLVVLRLDTPGGLDSAMREIIKSVLASSVAVVGFVAPEGARAASAGTFILYATHVAAMAPATTLGAATPVEIGGLPIDPRTKKPDDPMPTAREDRGAKQADPGKTPPVPSAQALRAKQINDAVAYIRGLAQLRGRNATWAESAVRDAATLTSEEAQPLKVIDLIARDVPDLLTQLDGREIVLRGDKVRLDTAGAAIETIVPDWRTSLLTVLTNPSFALILMVIGIYGLYFEFSSPGFGVFGTVGAISLALGLYGLHLLPVNYVGLGLLLLGIGLMAAEVFTPSFGALGLSGIAAFTAGAVFLIDTELPGYQIPVTLILALAASSAAFIFLVGGMALSARKRPVVSGREEMIGQAGEVIEASGTEGWASVRGERWHFRSSVPLSAGQRVRVSALTGLVLTVEPETTAQPKGA